MFSAVYHDRAKNDCLTVIAACDSPGRRKRRQHRPCPLVANRLNGDEPNARASPVLPLPPPPHPRDG